MLDFGQEKRAKSFVEFLVFNIHTDLTDLTDLFFSYDEKFYCWKNTENVLS